MQSLAVGPASTPKLCLIGLLSPTCSLSLDRLGSDQTSHAFAALRDAKFDTAPRNAALSIGLLPPGTARPQFCPDSLGIGTEKRLASRASKPHCALKIVKMPSSSTRHRLMRRGPLDGALHALLGHAQLPGDERGQTKRRVSTRNAPPWIGYHRARPQSD